MTTGTEASALIREAEALDERETAANWIEWTARDQLRMRTWALLDRLAAETGARRDGPVWDAARAYCASGGREIVERAAQFDAARAAAGMDPDAEREALNYVMVLGSTPSEIPSRVRQALGDARNHADLIRQSLDRTAAAWYGEAE